MNNLYKVKENECVDMHVHTIYSDGDLYPNEIIDMAYDKGIGTIAITDHDTVLGIKNLEYNEKMNYVNIIPGIELSCKVKKGTMHILGHYIDINNKNLNQKLDEYKTSGFYRIIALINQLKLDFGIIINYEDIIELFNKKGNIGRPHIAKILIKYGYVSSTKEAFEKYLISSYDKIRINNIGIDYKEAISLIHEAGGFATLAHPNQLLLKNEELDNLIQKMKACGLDGIEVYHSGHSKTEIEYYKYLADKYNLLISGGSDYHGSNKPNIELGICNSGQKVKTLSIIKK